MAELSTEHVFEGTVAQVFEAIRQYSRYPQYIPGVTAIDVLPAKVAGSTCQVRYDLKLIKNFFYTMNMFEEAPNRIFWHLAESNLMKRSDGSWTLKDLGGGKTHAIYALDISFKGLVPSAIVDQVTKGTLPGVMKGFQKLIEDMRAGK